MEPWQESAYLLRDLAIPFLDYLDELCSALSETLEFEGVFEEVHEELVDRW